MINIDKIMVLDIKIKKYCFNALFRLYNMYVNYGRSVSRHEI